MWFLLQFYCSPHLYVNNKTAESRCIYKLMPFYVQTGLHNTYKIYFSMTWAALTGRCNSLCGAFYFTDFMSLSVCVLQGSQTLEASRCGVQQNPRSGYMLEFDIYLGHVLAPMPHGLGHHVIMIMADWFLQRGNHLFFNNYFSSVQLGQDLAVKGTYMCSTIRLNRSGWSKELNMQCAKTMKAGDIHFRQDGNMVATLWKDKRPVAILSTNAQPQMGEAERKAPGGKKVAGPKPVLAYTSMWGRQPGWPAPLLLPCWTAICTVVAAHLLVVATDSHGPLLHHLEPKPPACSNQEGE